MKEIAAIFKLILSNTAPRILEKGKNAGQPSKVKYNLDTSIIDEGRGRIEALLDTFVLYPDLDLGFLKTHFGNA